LIDNLPIAFLEPSVVALMIPITALMIPIVAMLVKHQQRMAEILHGSGGAEAHAEITQLRGEVYELKQLVHQQMISVDSLVSSQTLRKEPAIQERLGQP
jgi:hypothetical protein